MSNQTKEIREAIRGKKIPADWEKTSLGKVSKEMADGGTPDRTGENDFFGGDINWAVIEDIRFEIENTKEKLTEEGLKSSSATLWPKGSVIVSTGASIGKVGLAKKPTATKQGITGIISKDKITPHFLARYLQYKSDLLDARAQGSTIQEIRPYLLKELKMPLPSKPEQRRIASVLHNVEQAIQKTEEIIKQTQRVKKGLMQNFFTDGYYDYDEYQETRIGPKKYKIPLKWKTEPIGKVGKVITGDTPSTDEEGNFGDKYPFVTPEDLKNNKYITEVRRGVTEKGMEETKEIPENTVMMDCIGSDLGKVAISKRKLATNQQINSIVPREKFDPEFLYYSLQFISRILKAQAGSTATPIIRKSSFSALELFKPGVDEQEKIGAMLKSLDDNITEHRKIKEQLQRFRKGLMQDLLTGKVRTDENVEVLEEVVEYE